MKTFTSETQNTGKIGEDIAVRYLESKGFTTVERNYTKKWGELDIVVKKKDKIHFIEVKSVSTPDLDIESLRIRPEENLHGQKIERLKRAIQTYLGERGLSIESKWQFDLVCVYLDDLNKKAKVITFDNLIL
jgi:putative endonuclease